MAKMSIGSLAHERKFRRKYRWLFEIEGMVEGEKQYITMAARPSIGGFNTIQVHYQNESAYIAGKPEWDAINLTFLDFDESCQAIVDWLELCYTFFDKGTTWADGGEMETIPEDYKKTATATMLDGKGVPLEKYKFVGAWLESINYGDLDYSSIELANVECSMRYDKAYREKA